VIAGGAAIMASDLLATKVKQLAGHLLDANPDAIRIEDGMLHVEGAPEKSRSLRSIAEIAYGEPDRLPPGFEAGLEAQYRYQPPPMTLASAANACVVEVDTDTGFVKILRWISAEDCGTAINPTVVEGQIAGGLAQAIGMVLLEEMAFDARGNPTAATYKDYLLPAISDIPDFEFLHANTPSKSVGGMRGVGEGGAIIGSPTLINAIADALAPFGEVPLRLPLTPARLLSVIEGRNLTDAADHTQPKAASHVTAAGAGNRQTSPHMAASEAVVAGAGIQRPSPAATAAPPVKAQVAEVIPPAKAPVDGDWKMVLATPMGAQEMTGHFETNGQSLTGYLSSPQGQQSFAGTVEGNRLKFDLEVQKPMKLTLKYDIAVAGNRLTGKVRMGIFGSAKLTGERA
jgi:carbon-monoxide dehydrogenase large subunit